MNIYLKKKKPLTAHGRVFVTPVFAIGFAVAFPRVQYAPAVRTTFEFYARARQRTIPFVRIVSAIVNTVANRSRRRTIAVIALERSAPAISRLALALQFIRSVGTVPFAVTSKTMN